MLMVGEFMRFWHMPCATLWLAVSLSHPNVVHSCYWWRWWWVYVILVCAVCHIVASHITFLQARAMCHIAASCVAFLQLWTTSGRACHLLLMKQTLESDVYFISDLLPVIFYFSFTKMFGSIFAYVCFGSYVHYFLIYMRCAYVLNAFIFSF